MGEWDGGDGGSVLVSSVVVLVGSMSVSEPI